VDIPAFVRSTHGVAHRAALRRQGVTRHHIRKELDAGRVFRVGRNRIATHDCNLELLRAAALCARLTCVSAAKVYGLWAFDDDRLHISVPPTYSRASDDIRARMPLKHWGVGPVPTDATDLIEPLINVLLHVSQCQPRELAIAIFDSAVNTGAIPLAELERLADALGGCFRSVVDGCDGRADSGIESALRVRLALRGIVLRIQVMIDGHRVDGLIGDWLVIQTDGYGPHSDSAQRSRDLAQDRRLMRMGYTVLRYSYSQILYDWPRVEAEILAVMARGLHLRPHG
jgi:very-short-patch-repair endonuclease